VQIKKRKELGAYYTPPGLAQFLATWAISVPGQNILEPCVGQGSLVKALLARMEIVGAGEIVGCELNQSTFNKATELFKRDSVKLYRTNFLTIKSSDLGLFDVVVANPPFTRNHALSPALRRKLRHRDEFRGLVRGAPGLWVYFLIHSLSFLRPGGRLARIAPRAITFADYALPIIEELQRIFELVEIIQVTDPVSWEGGAQERAALVLASGYRIGPAPNVVRTTLGSFSTRAAQVSEQNLQNPELLRPAIQLGDLAKLEIGVVTGANRIFLLSREEADKNSIPKGSLLPVVSRARHVKTMNFTKADARALAKEGEKTLLLFPKRGLGKRRSAIRKYLRRLSATKRKSILWFSKRTPWWRVQLGNKCDAVFTYMNHLGPRITLVSANITCTNTLHRLIFADRDKRRMRTICVSALCTYTQLAAEGLGRIYGGGVLKFELQDARRLPLLIPLNPVQEATFNRINVALKAGAIETARELADKAIMPEFFGERWEIIAAKLSYELAACRKGRGTRSKG